MGQNTQETRSRHVPWWVHVLIAGLLYAGLTYGIPTLHSDNRRIAIFLEILPNLAPIGAIAFLLLGAKALYVNDAPKREEERPTSEGDDQKSKET